MDTEYVSHRPRRTATGISLVPRREDQLVHLIGRTAVLDLLDRIGHAGPGEGGDGGSGVDLGALIEADESDGASLEGGGL